MLIKKVKRFFETVTVAAEENGYCIKLDTRSIRTPEGSSVLLPTAELAEAIAEEWSNQEDEIKPLEMPLMRLACTAIDKVAPVRDQVIGQIARYGESDLLCYLSEGPDDLVERQSEHWQPLLDWLAETHGVSLKVTQGIVHVPQSASSLVKLTELIGLYENFKLSALGELTQLTGSVVLALACVEGQLSGQEIFVASQLDDDWQIEKWGEDTEALARRENLEVDIAAAVRYLETLG